MYGFFVPPVHLVAGTSGEAFGMGFWGILASNLCYSVA